MKMQNPMRERSLSLKQRALPQKSMFLRNCYECQSHEITTILAPSLMLAAKGILGQMKSSFTEEYSLVDPKGMFEQPPY